MAARDALGDSEFLLATRPPSLGQRRLTLIIAAILLAAFAVAAPFAATPLERFDAFIPTLEAIFFVTDLITAALLFSQFSIVRSRALFVLASGYLFTALIIIPHALTFPGAFAPTGLLGARLQTTVWLYFLWHLGFPLALLAYAWLKDEKRAKYFPQESIRSAIGWSVVIVTGLVCGLTWLVTAGEALLPRFQDQTNLTPFAVGVTVSTSLISAIALVLLWTGKRSVLDQWLMVAVFALITELAVGALFNSARFTVGWYAGRMFSLVTSAVVLVALLAETTALYARLARSYLSLQRERDNKLINLEAMAASISHEMRQPLSAMRLDSDTALTFLDATPPDLEGVRSALNDVVSNGDRADQVLKDIRVLFGKAEQAREPIEVNETALETLRVLRGELDDRGVKVHVDLATGLPLVMGHRGQLQEVFLNLVHNALEAMNDVANRARLLQVITQRHGTDAIVVAVKDSGPGIDPKRLNGVFDPFVTTKSHGMGLGLSICRTIIEHHGGELTAYSDGKNGALFQFVLPSKRVEEDATRHEEDR
jgi:signal transduction histidine kinase